MHVSSIDAQQAIANTTPKVDEKPVVRNQYISSVYRVDANMPIHRNLSTDSKTVSQARDRNTSINATPYTHHVLSAAPCFMMDAAAYGLKGLARHDK